MISSRFRRPVAASLLVAATVVAALLPPAHIHLAEHDDHGHAAAVEHAHWSSHGASRGALDDDDGRVIFVDHPALSSNVDTTFARPAAAIVALLSLPAAPIVAALERKTSGNSPRDGPARSLSTFRGPPLVL